MIILAPLGLVTISPKASLRIPTVKAVVTVEVRHDGTAKALITNVTDPADKEFNNTVRPPEEPEPPVRPRRETGHQTHSDPCRFCARRMTCLPA